MKKIACVFAGLLAAGTATAQDGRDFDNKFRFGLRVTPQPMWLVSGDKNNIASGAIFGFGFGLNMEYRFSNIAALLTGIGGDFEGGKYTFRNEPGVYQASYMMNEAGEFIKPAFPPPDGTTIYHLMSRKLSATFATIPAILKLSTNEYNGLKYFGMFGGEIGVRVKATADDTYHTALQWKDSTFTTVAGTTQEDININEEAGKFPARIGMNAGAGVEYRLGGSTSLFLSVNYYRSFTNFMRKESDFAFYKVETDGPRYVRNNLMLTGIRINVGIMF